MKFSPNSELQKFYMQHKISFSIFMDFEISIWQRWRKECLLWLLLKTENRVMLSEKFEKLLKYLWAHTAFSAQLLKFCCVAVSRWFFSPQPLLTFWKSEDTILTFFPSMLVPFTEFWKILTRACKIFLRQRRKAFFTGQAALSGSSFQELRKYSAISSTRS